MCYSSVDKATAGLSWFSWKTIFNWWQNQSFTWRGSSFKFDLLKRSRSRDLWRNKCIWSVALSHLKTCFSERKGKVCQNLDMLIHLWAPHPNKTASDIFYYFLILDHKLANWSRKTSADSVGTRRYALLLGQNVGVSKFQKAVVEK